MAVFSSNDIEIAINTGTLSAPSWKVIPECTGIGKTSDLNVDERDTYGSPFTKRTVTGGKKFDFSFEVRMNPENDAHQYLRDLAFTNDIKQHNDKQIKLTFPLADITNSNKRTEIYTGVIKLTADGGQSALDLAVLNFDFMSSKEVTITKES